MDLIHFRNVNDDGSPVFEGYRAGANLAGIDVYVSPETYDAIKAYTLRLDPSEPLPEAPYYPDLNIFRVSDCSFDVVAA